MEIFMYSALHTEIREEQLPNLEAKLPEGFKKGGYAKHHENFLTEFVYTFEPGLTREQISDITDILQDLGAASWQFRAYEKTNSETGNTIGASLIEEA
ncbi:hypothetical protein KY346_01390 [Candidatus Woesearchaeota archaeon]|nr:hypothetical protein [Candidatus Woesearchaeota archaeon]